MARFALHITAAPLTSGAHFSALRFARAALADGHQLHSIFFSQEAVSLANRYACPPQDEADLRQAWLQLAQQAGCELQVCIAGALRRGILDQREASRHGLQGASLADGFVLTGLGQLVDAMQQADRTLTFHGAG